MPSGQGRPLGSLMLWLEMGHDLDPEDHVDLNMRMFDRASRVATRERLSLEPGAEELFKLEADREHVDGLSEPEFTY